MVLDAFRQPHTQRTGYRERFKESAEVVPIGDLAAEYYFNNLEHAIVRRIAHARPDYASFLDFNSGRLFAKVEATREALNKRLTALCKEYFVQVVAYELQHAKRMSFVHNFSPTVHKDPEKLYQKGNPERIQAYFESAAKILGSDIWNNTDIPGTHGGSRWADIARTGARLWRCDETAPDELLDHVFDLTHNTGHLFSKERPLIDPQYLGSILDSKRDAISLKDFIDKISSYLGETNIVEAWKVDHESFVRAINMPQLRANRDLYPVLKNMVGAYQPTEPTNLHS